MPEITSLGAFAIVAAGLSLSPGPNMAYLISRTIVQGRTAGLISLAGVLAGFIFYMLCAAFGITALLLAVPFAYDAIRVAGAAYLLWLAWQAVRPGGRSMFEVQDLPHDSQARLFWMGLLTNLLNPKIAVMYLSLLPQFVAPDHGAVLGQTLVLGSVQILISMMINGAVICFAGSLARQLRARPKWVAAQRWAMGAVLASLSLRMIFDSRAKIG